MQTYFLLKKVTTWTNDNKDNCHFMVSLGHNNHIMVDNLKNIRAQGISRKDIDLVMGYMFLPAWLVFFHVLGIWAHIDGCAKGTELHC